MYYLILLWVLLGLINLLLFIYAQRNCNNTELTEYDREDFLWLGIVFALGPITPPLICIIHLSDIGVLSSIGRGLTRIYTHLADIHHKLWVILATPIKFTNKNG